MLTAQQLQALIQQAAAAAFVPAYPEADEALWGSFWQFDVIAPGYTLPALELAFLRATRLDRHWPETTTPEQFLADLRQTITHPQAGIWTITLAQQPCAVFAAEQTPAIITVVWYGIGLGYLYAGYRQPASLAHFAAMVQQRQPAFTTSTTPAPPHWIAQTLEQPTLTPIDAAILQWRLENPSGDNQ